MIRTVMIFLFMTAISSIAVAGMNTKIIVVEGFGNSYRNAIQNSLIEALNQTKGITIDSKKKFIKDIRERGVSQGSQSSHDVSVSKQMHSAIQEATQGTINEYRIIDSQKLNDGQWNIKLEVKIAEYKTPGISPHNRRKIAIIPFRTMQSSYIFQGQHISSSEISRRFTQRLVTEMTQARKFTVLDREYMEEFLREKQLILSPDSPISEQMKIGQVLGVDYLLIGIITNAAQKQTPYTIQVTGETGYDYNAALSADYRIIVMATRQIKWSDSITLSLGNDEIKRIRARQSVKIQDALFTNAAKMIVDRALDNIYPLRVVQVQSNGELILNQGGLTLVNGEMLDVFNAGEKIIDPYTGESLGSSETWVATVKITRVNPKMSYASLVKGQLADIKNGSICRRTEKQCSSPSKVAAGKTTDVQTTSGGGVILPFD